MSKITVRYEPNLDHHLYFLDDIEIPGIRYCTDIDLIEKIVVELGHEFEFGDDLEDDFDEEVSDDILRADDDFEDEDDFEAHKRIMRDHD